MGHPALDVVDHLAILLSDQPSDRLIHHRPVIDGHNLLADSFGNGV